MNDPQCRRRTDALITHRRTSFVVWTVVPNVFGLRFGLMAGAFSKVTLPH